MTLHSDFINGTHFRGIAVGDHKGWNVLHHFGASSQKSIASYAAKLVDSRETSNDYIVFDRDMPRQGAVVAHHHMIAHPAFVGHMGVGQEKVVAANSRAAILRGRRMDGAKLAEDIALSNR